ncbi:IPT/TIG domain-containing protein [Zhaonella formicivorans]|uniref:IPT/TIG domain-containing protein n=1 Tax=Zhaonella formicivorans TaxID=2528593 RepID=UPI0010DA0D2E|nr:IPT/TIG domain-containing protein [Zhaonella formicivorans]
MLKRNRLIAYLLLIFQMFTLFPGFTPRAFAASPPSITGVSPSSGPLTGGTEVTITGSSFSTVGLAVYFGDVVVPDSNYISKSTTKIVLKTPAYANPAQVDVRVVNQDLQSAVKANAFTYVSVPSIEEVTDLNGSKPAEDSTIGGKQIKIIGQNFMDGARVFLGGVEALNPTVNSAKTEITATVPPNANIVFPAEVTKLAVTVEVVNPDGGKATLSATDKTFYYRKSVPDFTTVTPSKGNRGTKVTISDGANGEFFPDSSKIDVLFGSERGDGIVVSGKTLTVNAPAGSGTVQITVKNPDGGAWTYGTFEYVLLPEITGIIPNSGQVGDKVIITGLNFSTISNGDPANLQVLFGSQSATFTIKDDNTLEVTVPPGNTGTVDVKVAKTDDPEISYTVTDGFIYTTKSNPVITKITPNAVSPEGGTEVLIEGSDFLINAQGKKPEVYFGTVKADEDKVTVESVSRLRVITPFYPYGTGKVNVHVVNWDGQKSDTSTVNFEFKQSVGITEVTPSKGSVLGGTPVTITGYNFPYGEPDVTTAVYIGNNEVPQGDIKVESPTRITITTPKGWLGGSSSMSFDVTVLVKRTDVTEKAVLKNGFTYIRPESSPKLMSIINPATGDATGPKAGGVTVYVYGEDIRDGAQIYFGAIVDDYKLVFRQEDIEWIGSTFRVKGQLPAVATPGPYDVVLVNPDGATAVLKNGFTFKGTNMWLSTVTPNTGPTAGGTQVTLFGANFNEGNEIPQVLFIDEQDPANRAVLPADSVQVSADGKVITAVTPKFTPGVKRVVVRNSFGETTNPVYFTYQLGEYRPVIDAVYSLDENGEMPGTAQGPVTGGTKIVIYGEQFATGLTVLVGGKPASDVVVESSGKISAVTPPCTGEPGLKEVVVTNRIYDPGDGQYDEYSAVKKDAFFYYSSPVITGVSPKKASIYGGNVITVTGEQFYPGARVQLSTVSGQVYDLAAPSVKVVDQTTIKFRVPTFTEADAGAVSIKIVNSDGGSAQWDDFRLQKPQGKVEIYQITPHEGPETGGTPVVITGEGFNPDAAVYFGWEPARSVEVISPNEIRVVTPPNLPGLYDVTVSNLDDTSTAVKAGGFEYKTPKTSPKITGVYPNTGPKAGGTKIKITGQDFWPGAQVFIGPYQASEVQWEGSRTLTAITPAGDIGTYDVMVINTDASVALLKGGFTYKSPGSSPRITAISPAKVPTTGGTDVLITGVDLRKGVKVLFDTTEVNIVEFDEAQGLIRVKAPAHEKGKVDVTVLNSDGGLDQWFAAIEYALPESEPKITGLDPVKGSVAGGTWVTITGDDFRVGSWVYFGGKPAADVVLERYDRLTALTPPGKAGKVDVTVTNSVYLGSFTLKNAFEYVTSVPQIISLAPDQGSYLGGTLVTITGKDFVPGAKVLIGEREATVVGTVSPDSITILTPASGDPPLPSQVGYKEVKIVNPDGAVALKKEGFRYLYPDSNPSIHSISPDRGSTAGGMPVVITGTDFRQGAKVIIGGKEAVVISVDDTAGEGKAQIVAKTPPHTEGAKNVVVINYDGASAIKENGFIYEKPLSFPEITEIKPSQGPTLGRTSVTITGNWFKDTGANGEKKEVRVWFGNYPATNVRLVDYRTITAETPPGQEGFVDVLVLNADMGQAVKPKGFKYIKVTPPEITKVEPAEGPSTGGTGITITGQNFSPGAQVYIGGAQARDVTVEGKTILKAVTPAGPEGWQEVRVVNPDGGWNSLEQGFYYYKPRSAPDTPMGLDASAKDYDTIELSWYPVDFVNNYEVYISTGSTGQYRFLDQVNGTDPLNQIRGKIRYYATRLKPDTRYYFKVRAVNELGLSDMTGYASAVTKDNAPDGYRSIPEPDEVIFSSGTDAVEVVVPSAKALSKAGQVVDLRSKEYDRPLLVIKFNGAALAEASSDIFITSKWGTLSFKPKSILAPQHWNSSSAKLKDVYSNLVIADLGQREAERAIRSLPKNAKLLSGIYSIGWEKQEGKQKTAMGLFFDELTLYLRYAEASLPAGKEARLYIYNDSLGKWEQAETVKGLNTSTIIFKPVKPVKLALIAQ